MDDMKNGLAIGDVARGACVSVETVRFYQRSGLIEVPERFGTSRRRYSDEVVARVKFIQRVQALGFSLKETEELLTLGLHAAADRSQVRSAAEAALVQIEGRIRDLEKIRGALHEVIGASKPPPHTSPLLLALYPDAPEEPDGTEDNAG